jgi:hypothetical protein
VNRVKSCDANLRVWVAKQPTGDATKVGGEVPRGTSGREPCTGRGYCGMKVKFDDVALFTIQIDDVT